MNTTTGDRPIGFLLRTLDRLIDERFDHALAGHGVTRRQWQLLNTLARTSADLDSLTAAVAPFLAGETARPHLDPLVADGTVTRDGDTYTLTATGRATLGALAAEVRTIRDATVAGLADGEYERTVTTLETMIGNLRE
jgi:hypothetical protein